MTDFLHKFRCVIVVALLILSVTASYGLTPPALSISDSAGNVVSVDSTGTVVFSGSCTASTCITNSVAVSPGKISWNGTIGAFTVSSEVGTTKPILSPPSLDLNLHQLTSTTGGTITIQWTDVGFNVAGGTTGSMSAGGTYNVVVDSLRPTPAPTKPSTSDMWPLAHPQPIASPSTLCRAWRLLRSL